MANPNNLTEARALLESARAALLQGRPDEAVELAQRVLVMEPSPVAALPFAWLVLGEAQVNLRRVEDGIRSLLRAIRLNPRLIEPYLAIGSLYERAGKTALMIRLYRFGLRHSPDAIPLAEHLASVHAARFEFREAVAVANAILKRRTLDRDYLRLGTFSVALGDLEAAEKAFQQALAQNPKSWRAHYDLAELYFSAQLMHRARDHYAAAIDCGPGEYEPLNGMGLFVLTVDRDPARALHYLELAERVAPERPEARFNSALAHAAAGDLSRAQEATDAVLDRTRPGDGLRREAERLRATLLLKSRSGGSVT